jgi:transcriptional regulator with XRE-family HTH domain
MSNELMATLVKEKMTKDKLSFRKAGDQVGVSHTTIQRVADGEQMDLPTTQKIADWLRIPLSTLLDLDSKTDDQLAKQIAAVLYREPQLATVFGEAMKRVLTGEMQPDTFRALAQYAAFQITTQGDVNEQASKKFETTT